MIKNLIFDFGGVLVAYNFEHIVDPLFTNEEDRRTFKSLFIQKDFIDLLDKEDKPFGEIIEETKQQYPRFAKQLDVLYLHYADFVTGEVPCMRDVLAECKKRGYKLYGLTNWNSAVYEVMRRYPEMFSLLDDRLISSEEHLLKPHKEIYDRLCEKFHLKAEECLFTDDHAVNVEGAIQAGLKGIVFQNAKQYVDDLIQMQING